MADIHYGLKPGQLLGRFDQFTGEWLDLLEASRKVNQQGAVIRRRGHRRSDDGIEKRISKAEALVHMGEVSSARQALEGSSLAPGTEATLNTLRDPSKQPREPQTPVLRELSSPEPRSLFNLEIGFCRNLRSARRGATAGPSGMTVEHLQPLLDMPRDLRAFFQAGEVVQGTSTVVWGRMTALEKPNGGVYGIVVGDIVRRLVARTMSQQMMEEVQSATAPFQIAMSTRGGCECIAHALQGLTEMNARATVVSIDGISAYNLVSRKAMLQGLNGLTVGSSALPFVSNFYGTPSSYLWEDSTGWVHTITARQSTQLDQWAGVLTLKADLKPTPP